MITQQLILITLCAKSLLIMWQIKKKSQEHKVF